MPALAVGITGTRQGMGPRQLQTFYDVIKSTPMREFHHGCCFGADRQAYMAMYDLCRTVPVHAWPPADEKWMATDFAMFADVIHPPNDYHSRDRDIVDNADILIAAPLEAWPTSGGTAYTMGYAVEQEVPVLLIKPDGSWTYL